ncbi:MAG: ABC transporter substrate-binding protein [Rhodothermales bacterium]
MSRLRPILFYALIAVVLPLLTSCAPSSDSPASSTARTVTDGLGRDVAVTATPQRVVTIAPGATHIVRAAGALDRLTAVTTADYEVDDLAHLPRISALPLDLEAIVGLNPDLVLASEQVNDPAHAEMFDALGIPILYLGADSWSDVHESILTMGSVFNTDSFAQAAADSLESLRRELIELTGHLDKRPTGIFLVSHITSYSFGNGSYVLDLMDWAGIHPLTRSFDTPAPILDDEWVLLNNPDVILGSFGESGTKDALLDHHPTWRSLDAIRSDRVVDVPSSMILTPGPDNIRAAWHMARIVHPTLFDSMATGPFSGSADQRSSAE